MKFLFNASLALLFFSNADASQLCINKNKPPLCGLRPKAQIRNYANIQASLAKNADPEETLTIADARGVRSEKYENPAVNWSNQNPITINVNPNLTYQTMYGFGASITESCLENLKNLSPSARDDFFKKVFDKKNGAGFGYLRVPIGANDFSNGDYTLDDTPGNKPDPELKHFDGKKLKNYIQFIKEAKKYNPDIKLLMSPWTPPAWMKDTQVLKGGQIKKEYFEAYAKYLSKTLDEFESQGVPMDQMTVLNEPLIGGAQEKWFFPQAYISPKDQNSFIQNNMSSKLKGRKTKILLHDHNWDNATDIDPVLAQNKNNPAVQGMAYHCYGGNFSNLQKNLEKTPGVPSFNTECTSSMNKGADQDTYNWWQNTQSLDAVKSGISGSLGWNLCLDEKGGPQNNGCRDCRGMVTIDSQTKAVNFNPEFKALAATSKVIDAGSIRIDSKDPNEDTTSIAFKNPDGSLSMVIKNKTGKAQSYNVNIDDCTSKQYYLPAGATLSTRWFPY